MLLQIAGVGPEQRTTTMSSFVDLTLPATATEVENLGGGVIRDIALRFDFSLDDINATSIGALIGHVAPMKTLQDNIAFAREKLGDISIARDWVTRTGLLYRTSRNFVTGEEAGDEEAFVVRGGVARWMRRGLAVAFGLVATNDKPVHIYGSQAVMRTEQFDDVIEGMTENDYAELLQKKLYPQLIVHPIDRSSGADVAAAIATNHQSQRIGVCTVAGNWVQAAGQVHDAAKTLVPECRLVKTLTVHTDSYKLGVTGEESPATHQNPYSAIGVLLRSAQAAMKT